MLRCGVLRFEAQRRSLTLAKPLRSQRTQPAAAASSQSSVPEHNDIFISHAEKQKDFALWLRDHTRIHGYRAFVGKQRCGFCCRPSHPAH